MVDHEIVFAVDRGLGLAALTQPGTTRKQQFKALDEAWRIRLAATDLTGPAPHSRLTDRALTQVLVDVELRHAAAARLRREQALRDALGELAALAYRVEQVGDRALLAWREDGRPSRQEVVLVTGYAPVPGDLRAAERERQRHRRGGTVTRGWVVHPTEDIDLDRASLMAWLSRRRSVAPAPVMLLHARITA